MKSNPNKLKALIVDDERLARRELRSLLADFEEIEIIGEAETLSETIDLIKRKKPDVVFLDIQLSNENGFDLLEKIEKNFKLIFVTAFDEFAIRAFEINALDYLLKPVNPERLETAVARLFDEDETPEDKTLRADRAPTARRLEIDDRLFLEVNERSCFVEISEISRISAAGDYTELFLDKNSGGGGKFLVDRSLREWEERLPEKYFARIHRSNIVNIRRIEKIELLFNRTMEVFMENSAEPLPVSRRYAAKLKEKFG